MSTVPDGGELQRELDGLRAEIERIDGELTRLIAERVDVARRAGALKRAAGMFTLDPEREASVVRRAVELARAAGLNEEDVRGVFWQIIGLSRRAQQEQP